eukprot:TRINITY_DN38041_c0_g1_i1.p2 TRINITY_DN38041_c0_g1~~TRINITY_DN38041_c0_g1_i1.p2  ORF type:complete len:110 (+),score=26.38 TRINITY_DN38041_c0_g1_i1:120-449(+)
MFFFFNDTATTEIYTLHIVGSVRCVQETDIIYLNSKLPYPHHLILAQLYYIFCFQTQNVNLIHSPFILVQDKIIYMLFKQSKFFFSVAQTSFYFIGKFSSKIIFSFKSL